MPGRIRAALADAFILALLLGTFLALWIVTPS